MNLNKENAPPSQLQIHHHSAMHKPQARNPVAPQQQQIHNQLQTNSGGQERAPAVASSAQSNPVASPVSNQPPKVYLTSDQIKVQLGKKLDDLDSKYLQHRNLAVTKALSAYDDLIVQSREDAVVKMREAHEAELIRERAAHASSLHALSLALQAAEARCTEMDNERTQTNSAMTELKRKYDMLWTKWKELKVLLASKTAAKNNQQQSNGRSSPLITASSTNTSTSPAPVASSSTSPPVVQMPPAVAPTTISQLFADDNEEGNTSAPAPVATTSSPRTTTTDTVSVVSNRFAVASQDPFASQAQTNGLAHTPVMLQSRVMPSLAALIASSASSSPTVTTPLTMSPPISAPVSLAAVLAASDANLPSTAAISSSNVWKSKKVHTTTTQPPQQPQQPQPTAPMTDNTIPNATSIVAAAAVRPPSPSLPALESAFGVPADIDSSSTRISPALAPATPVVPPSNTVSHDRARVESIDDDDCIMVATAASSSVRKRAHAPAISPSRPRSTSPSSSTVAPQAWKPSSTSNAARKRLREGEEKSASGANGPRRTLPPMITGQVSPSPAKKQRPPVPIQPFNSPPITAASPNGHVPAALITAPAAAGIHSPAEQLSDPHSEGLSGLTQRPRQAMDTTDSSPHMDADGHASRLTQEAKDTVEELPGDSAARDTSLNISKPMMSLSAMLAANSSESSASATVSTSKPVARVANVASVLPVQTPPRPSPAASAAQLIDITNSPPDVAAPPRVTTSSSSSVSAPAPTPHISTERNREIRETLPGYSCKQCELFYTAVGKGAEHSDGRTCEHVSRHRYEFPIALTPEHYWNIGSPESARSFHEESQTRTVTNPNVQRSINAALSSAVASATPPQQISAAAAATRPAPTPVPVVASRPSATIVAAAAVTTMPDYNPTSQEVELDQQLYGNNSLFSMMD